LFVALALLLFFSAFARKACKIELQAVMSGLSTNIETTTVPTVPSARRRWILLAAMLVATAALVWSATGWRARIASAQVRSLAILPFTEVTPQNENWLAASFTGEAIDALSRVPGLHITGRTSAFAAKSDAARQLGAAAVLEGTVQQTGDRLHVTVSMTRVSDSYHLWSADFERPADDLRVLQQSIAAAIASRLDVRMPPASRHIPTAQAYAAYLQGRYLLDQAAPDALNHAEEHLAEATAADPNFARAWAWLSIAREYRVAAGMARPNQLMPGSRDAAERAVALDVESGDAHLALGIVKLQYDWDWPGAKQELDRALQSMPESAAVLAWHARWYRTQGRMEEAIAETARALALDPLSAAIAADAAAQYVALNRPGQALPFAQKAVDLNPDDAAARAALVNVLLLAGQQEKARQVLGDLRTSAAASKLPPSVLAELAARMGEPADARQLLDQAEDLPDDQLLLAVDYAGLAGVLEDWDRLFSWVEEAYGERDLALPYWPGSPLAPKSDPRFDAFLAQMNLPAPSESR
jgi:TolB-like protein/Tfp pilus assembly protein PilF